jgi:hypothetical protein
LDGALNTNEGNASTLLRKVLLQRWRRVTTRSLLVYLNFEKDTHEINETRDHMDGQCQENLPTVLGGMVLPVLETKVWRMEDIVLDVFVIHLG